MQSSLVVALGAALGAAGRWWVGEALASETFPWATLTVNLLGCTAIGYVAVRLRRGSVTWYFVVTGCLGGFTTASAFAAETRQLVDDGRSVAALAFVAVSGVGGLIAVAASRRWAERGAP